MSGRRYTPSLYVAQEEIRQQMERALALVLAVHDQLRGIVEADAHRLESIALGHLLDMADEILGRREYFNVVAPHPGAEVVPIRKFAPADAEPEHAQ